MLGQGPGYRGHFPALEPAGRIVGSLRPSRGAGCDPSDGGDSGVLVAGDLNADMVKSALYGRAFLWHPKYTGPCFLGIPNEGGRVRGS